MDCSLALGMSRARGCSQQRASVAGASLVVQWLRVRAPNAGGPCSIPGQGTSSHTLQLKIPPATIRMQYTQINKNLDGD